MTIPSDSRFRLFLIVAFFSILWIGLWRQLSGEWSVNDQYSYGWFVPFFAIVLFWLRWEDAPEAQSKKEEVESRKRKVAIFIAIIALLLLFPIRLFEIGNPDWRPLSWLHALCVVAITLIFLWRIGGPPWLRHFAFPVAFTLVAVPWVTPIEEPIVQGLMRVVAAISSELVALFGIPAQLEGNLIRIPNGLVGVNEACSGVRSLQTSLMIGLLFGELKRLSISRRVVLIVAAAAIAFFGNCARSFFLVWIAATRNIATANSWHDFAGYAIVALVFLGTLILAWRLGKSKEPGATKVESRKAKVENGKTVLDHDKLESRKAKEENGRQGTLYFLLPTFYFAAAICWIFFTEIAAASWYRAHETNLARSAQWKIQWPRNAPNFREIKIDEEMRRALRFDHGEAASWSLPASNGSGAALTKPLTCTLYFFRWNSGKNSALLANLHRPDVCLPSIGWSQTNDSGVKNYQVAPDLALPFRHFEFRHGTDEHPTQQTAHAFYCLWEDRVRPENASSQLPQMMSAPSAWTRDERVRVVLEGRRHLGQEVAELIIQTRGPLDIDQVNTAFAALVPKLIKVESSK